MKRQRNLSWQTSIKVEPYWNVKKEDNTGNEEFEEIKVEPYWNVKYVEDTFDTFPFPLK